MKVRTVAELKPRPTVAPIVRPLKVEPFFERVKEFQDAIMRHAYEFFAPYPFTTGRELEKLLRTEFESLPVPLELTETEEAYMIHAEVPGFKEKEIEVRVEPWRVYIGGKRDETVEEKKGKTLYSERGHEEIARWYELPAEIDPEKVKATLTEGLLEITLKKAQVAKRVPVEIKAA